MIFYNHLKIQQCGIARKCRYCVIKGIIQREAATFYRGKYGLFSGLSACRYRNSFSAKRGLILAYPNSERPLPRFAISQRNRWMVDASHVVVACRCCCPAV